MRVLIVEDEPIVREVLGAAIRAVGHRTVQVANTLRADDVLAREPVEALTLDLGLPGCDAIAWLERIAVSRPEISRRTVVVTGREPSPDEARRIARTGAGVLLKPFALAELRGALRLSGITPPSAEVAVPGSMLRRADPGRGALDGDTSEV